MHACVNARGITLAGTTRQKRLRCGSARSHGSMLLLLLLLLLLLRQRRRRRWRR
jgi:hypothetical protein